MDNLNKKISQLRKKQVYNEDHKTVKLTINDDVYNAIREIGFDKLFEILEKYPPSKQREQRNFKIHKGRIRVLRDIKFRFGLSFTDILLYALRTYARLNQYNHFGILDQTYKK